MPENGYFFDGEWLTGWSPVDLQTALDLYHDEAKRLYEQSEYALVFSGKNYGLSFSAFFRGIEHAIQMLMEPNTVHEKNSELLEKNIEIFDAVNKSFGQYIDIITIGDDMGGQQGPLANPSNIREYSIPYYKEFCSYVHKNSDIKVFMHNCGSIRAILQDLIEAGIDIINPVQITAKDMDPESLVKEFGRDIVFWGGGCDTQNILSSESTEIVSHHVRNLLSIWKKSGAYVFSQVHNILGNVPSANIVTMLDTAYKESFL
jgi:uroporphyrinogen decarboxylase